MNKLIKINLEHIRKELKENTGITLTDNEIIESAIAALVKQENLKSVKVLHDKDID